MGNRITIAVATLAVFGLALPVAAQDAPSPVALAYVDESVDRPIAETLAALNNRHGRDTRVVDGTFVENHGHRLEGMCVVTVGLLGDRMAEVLTDRHGVDAVSAQGADRYETAQLAAEAVADCN